MERLQLASLDPRERNGALLEWYKERSKGKRYSPEIALTFSEPTRLHYSRRTSKDKVAMRHVIKGLFKVNGEGGVAYHAGRCVRSGFYLPMIALESAEIVETKQDFTEDWRKISASMRRHGINDFVASDIERVLAGRELTRDDGKTVDADYQRNEQGLLRMHWAQNWWTIADKPRIVSFADLTVKRGYPTIDAFKEETMKHKSEYRQGGFYYGTRKDGSRRDRSVSMEIDADGKTKFYAASEYAGCGNGAYYVMFSPTQAVYSEHD